MIQIYKGLFYHVNVLFIGFSYFVYPNSLCSFIKKEKNSMWIFYFPKLIEANMDSEWSPIPCTKY